MPAAARAAAGRPPRSCRPTGSRQITIQADFIGAPGTATGATGVRATLTDDRTGQVTTLTRANGGIVSWTPGTRGPPADTIRSRSAIPALRPATFTAGPEAADDRPPRTPTAACPPSTGSPCTSPGRPARHGHLQPERRERRRRRRCTGHRCRPPSTPRRRGSLLVLSPGTYNENVAGVEAAEDPGRRPGRHHRRARAPGPRPGGPAVPRPRLGHRRPLLPAERDGVRRDRRGARAVRGRRATPPGAARRRRHRGRPDHDGVRPRRYDDRRQPAPFNGPDRRRRPDDRATAKAPAASSCRPTINNMQLTNNVLENNGGVVAGGIGDRPAVRPRQPQLQRAGSPTTGCIGNGGLTQAGGLGIFYGSNNYEVAEQHRLLELQRRTTAPASRTSGSARTGRSTTTRSTTTTPSTPARASRSSPSCRSAAGARRRHRRGRRRPQPDPEQLLRRRRRRHLRARRPRRSRSTSATT